MTDDTVRDGLARALFAARLADGDYPDGTGVWDDVPEDWREACQVLADAALAYLAGQRVDVEAVARVLAEHQPTTGMSVASGVTCRCGYWNGNEVGGKTRPVGYQGLQWHQAEMIAALTPDVSNPADAVLPYDGPDFDLVMAGHDLSLVPHWPGPGKWCEVCPTPVPATADAWDEGYVSAQENHDCNGRSAPAVNPYRPTVDGAR